MTEVFKKLLEIRKVPGNPPKLHIIREDGDEAQELAESLMKWAIKELGIYGVEITRHSVDREGLQGNPHDCLRAK